MDRAVPLPVSLRIGFVADGASSAPTARRDGVAPTATRPAISATVLTRDSARRLADVLRGLAWCDEIVVLDTGSTDATIEIARAHPRTRVHALAGAFVGFGDAHRQAVALARNDWILSIDSDEVISPVLAAELQALDPEPAAVYALRFHNHFNGRVVRSCGWFPDCHPRLFHRRTTNFCESEVHERVVTRGLDIRMLANPIDHYSYDSVDDFLRKMRAYCALFAAQHAGRKRSSRGKAIGHGLWAFVKSFFLQRGCLEGYEGLVISTYKAHTAFWKYLALLEANRARGRCG